VNGTADGSVVNLRMAVFTAVVLRHIDAQLPRARRS